MPKISKKRRKLIVQFVEYMISGGAYFWVGYVILLYLYHSLHWSLWWSTIVSNIIGWAVNYMLQRYWVFRNPHLKNKLAQTSIRYIIITLVDFVLNYLILYWLKKSFSIDPAIGQFISSAFF